MAGTYLADLTALSTIAVPAPTAGPFGGAGLLLGRDGAGTPVVLRLFRPEPVKVAMVGNWSLARLVVFRALALGARVIVRTAAADQWQGLGEFATGGSERVFITAGYPATVPAGSAAAPVLYLNDLDGAEPPVAEPEGPWLTRLTLVRQLTGYGAAALQEAQITLLQRLLPAEAAVAAGPLRLDPRAVENLQTIAEDLLALIEGPGGAQRLVQLVMTPVERSHLRVVSRAV